MNYIKLNKKAYTIAAEQYEKRIITNLPCEVDSLSLIKFINPFLSNKKTKKMLEIGPGNGLLIRLFSEKNYETTGIDFSDKMITIASKTSPESKFINANVLDYDFEEDYFDVICAAAILHCFPKKDAKKLLNKIHKWLNKQNGIFYTHTTLEKDSREGLEVKSDYDGSIIRYRKRYKSEEFRELLEKNSFRILKFTFREEKYRNKLWQCYICSVNNSK
jgi:ubiquinone/menaquinone biosynthesis C-methylase UbiE